MNCQEQSENMLVGRLGFRPVMAGLDPAIPVFKQRSARKAWMPGTRPGMTQRCQPDRSAAAPRVPLSRVGEGCSRERDEVRAGCRIECCALRCSANGCALREEGLPSPGCCAATLSHSGEGEEARHGHDHRCCN